MQAIRCRDNRCNVGLMPHILASPSSCLQFFSPRYAMSGPTLTISSHLAWLRMGCSIYFTITHMGVSATSSRYQTASSGAAEILRAASVACQVQTRLFGALATALWCGTFSSSKKARLRVFGRMSIKRSAAPYKGGESTKAGPLRDSG